MSVSVAASTDVVVPLELTVEQEGVGGVTGLTGANAPTVRLRDGTTDDTYLDFSDNTFKTSGWTTLNQALAEVGNGHYNHPLDLSAITGLALGNMLVAEYSVDDGGDVKGEGHDIIVIGNTTFEDLVTDVSLIRKSVTNRMWETPGTPGKLVLYDDDDVTPVLDFDLNDAVGGGIASPALAPARRSKSSI